MKEHDFEPRLLVTEGEWNDPCPDPRTGLPTFATRVALVETIKRMAGYQFGPNLPMEVWWNDATEWLNWRWLGAVQTAPLLPLVLCDETMNPIHNPDREASFVCRFTTREAKR